MAGRWGPVLLLALACQPAPTKGPAASESGSAAGTASPGATPAPCAHRDRLRRPWFGETHLHTALSADAGTGARIRGGPDDVYAFARGRPLGLPPYDAEGLPTRRATLERSLDFAMLADHAELLGAGTGAAPAQAGTGAPWRLVQAAAARWNEPCAFTTFVGYEVRQGDGTDARHRNVLFRNASVPERPIDARSRTLVDFWAQLRQQCHFAGSGCDAIAIPHAGKRRRGPIVVGDYAGATSRSEQARIARLRSAMEPLVEIFQRPGDAACLGEAAADERCDFEAWPREALVQRALVDGLRETRRIGEDPFQAGFSASMALRDAAVFQEGATAELRLVGGLAGVWAEENTRAALFDAMRRRETFATSGPRIVPRFFGSWGLPQDLCARADWVELADRVGVPMGGELRRRPPGRSPSFVVSALRDPDPRGVPLERLQIVKSWADARGRLRERVYDVAGGPTGATVDTRTCEARGPGYEGLCTVWRDPAFDPTLRAVYYARILENPSCRPRTRQCNALPAAARPDRCETGPETLQQRAWTSPIWYLPGA